MAARREFFVTDCVKSYVIDIQRGFERGSHDADGLDYTVFHLDWVINILVRYSGSGSIHPRVIDLLHQVKDAVIESLHTFTYVYRDAWETKEQLEFLISFLMIFAFEI